MWVFDVHSLISARKKKEFIKINSNEIWVLPLQITPSPLKPSLQVQLKPKSVFVQSACDEQLFPPPCPRHSLISFYSISNKFNKKRKEKEKTPSQESPVPSNPGLHVQI